MQTSNNKKGLFFVQVILSPVPELANGVLNHSSKDFTELKFLGRTKLKTTHNSGRLFQRGVPENKVVTRVIIGF